MLKALYIIFYFVNTVWNYSQFKFIKYENTWMIFKRFGDKECLYYEEVHNQDSFLFPSTNNKYLYLAYNKVLKNKEEWKMQNCPEVEKNVHSIKNIQHIETGQWFKGSNVSNPINDIEDYDIESCMEYENFNFQLDEYSQILNLRNVSKLKIEVFIFNTRLNIIIFYIIDWISNITSFIPLTRSKVLNIFDAMFIFLNFWTV